MATTRVNAGKAMRGDLLLGAARARWRRPRLELLSFWACFVVLGCNRPEATPSQPRSELTPDPGGRSVQPAESPPAAHGELVVGGLAPDFTRTAHTGQTVTLSKLRGKAVVLYFYPKDGTPGCTTEAEQFREHHAQLEGAGAIVLGVSSDDAESHQTFADDLALPFLLLPDPDRSLAKAYGVGGFLGMSRRVTFLIGPDGKIAKIYPSVSPKEHAQEILADLATLGLRPSGHPIGD